MRQRHKVTVPTRTRQPRPHHGGTRRGESTKEHPDKPQTPGKPNHRKERDVTDDARQDRRRIATRAGAMTRPTTAPTTPTTLHTRPDTPAPAGEA